MKNFLTWFEDRELEKTVYKMILRGVIVVALLMACIDYFFYAKELAFLELLFALVSLFLLRYALSYRIGYTLSSRIFIVFMSLPIYWNLLFNESAIESTILFIFLPILSIILRPLKEVIFFATFFGGTFLYISFSGIGMAQFTLMELFKLISMQGLISFFVVIYVQTNKNYQEIIAAQGVELKNTNTKLEKLYKEKEIEASTDTLTGLSNRSAMMSRLRYLYARYKRQKEIFSLIIFDVDHFKSVNDNFGHQKGDEILKEVAQITLEGIREIDMASRYGGEEFVVLLPQTNADAAFAIAERIRLDMQEKIRIEEESITASFGLVEMEENRSIDELIKRADEALYEAKRSGRNRVVRA